VNRVTATPRPAAAAPPLPTRISATPVPATPVPVTPATPVPATPVPATPVPATPPLAPAPTPARPSPTPAAPPETADSLYASAETALAHGDDAVAERLLGDLIARYPAAPVLDQALYERAQLAYHRHAYQDAQSALAALARISSTPLADPGAYLACRIDVETHDSSAHACIVAYRRAYPGSPHDLDLLGWLIDEAMHDGGCTRAAPLIDELAKSHANAPLVQTWRARCSTKR
jgi:predicted Zn-dependent protease